MEPIFSESFSSFENIFFSIGDCKMECTNTESVLNCSFRIRVIY